MQTTTIDAVSVVLLVTQLIDSAKSGTVNCGDPGTPSNGYHNGGGPYAVGAQITYNCVSGYVLTGSQELTCTGSGEWNHPAPTCDPVNCGDPGTVENAQRTGDVFTYPSSVTYTCNDGNSGSITIECLSSGEWVPENKLVCAPTDGGTCGDPGTVDNAERMGDVFTVGSLVMYTCMAGYVISGSSTILCTSSNNWNDSLPTCEKLTSQITTTPLQASKFTSQIQTTSLQTSTFTSQIQKTPSQTISMSVTPQTPSSTNASSANASPSNMTTVVIVIIFLLFLVAVAVGTAAALVFWWHRRRKRKSLSFFPSICEQFLAEINPRKSEVVDDHKYNEVNVKPTVHTGPFVQEQIYEDPDLNAHYEFNGISNALYQVPFSSNAERSDCQDKASDSSPYEMPLSKAGDSSPYEMPLSKADGLCIQLDRLGIKKIPIRSLQVIGHLGSGEFGDVQNAFWTKSAGEKLEVAVKTLKEGAVSKERVKFLQEAAIMGQFHHPNVVMLHGVVLENQKTMLILEMMSKGDLHHYLIQLRKDSHRDVTNLLQLLLTFCQQVCAGMSYLARKAYIHRDLAARNILIAKDLTCKVADFGMSRDLADEDYYYMSQQKTKLPIKWTAPEVFSYKKYSSASDVWSFGCVMYEIWSLGHKPFEGFSNVEAVREVTKGYRLCPSPGCPKEVYETMINCWNPTARERPTFDDIVLLLSQSEEVVLKIPVEALSSHPQAGQLGAPLEAGENMYLDLQHTYVS